MSQIVVTFRGGVVMCAAPNQKQDWKRVNRMIEEWSVTYPDLSAWLEETIAHALAEFGRPTSHRKRLRTTNGLKRFQLRIHPLFLPRVILTGYIHPISLQLYEVKFGRLGFD
jgi:hypothetical protein